MAGFGDIEDRFYTCSICMSPYEDPRSLPCLHTFCENCLREYTESRGFARVGGFPCPQCRNETTIPHGGVSQFPSNFQLLELIEHLRQNVAASTPTTTSAQAPPTHPPITGQAPPRYSQVVAERPSLYPQLGVQAPPIYPQTGMQAPPTNHPSAAQAPPTNYPQAPPTKVLAPPPAPLQRTLHINPSDHVVPVERDVKHALLVFGRQGNSLTEFTTPVGLTRFADKYIVVSDQRGNRVFVFDLNGKIQSMFTCHGLVQGIAYDPHGSILVANPKTGRALAKSFTLKGQTKATIGNQFTHEKPHGIAATSTNIAISSLETNKVFVLDASGRLVRELGGTGSRKMQLRAPYYLTLNAGNDVIVSDSGNHAVKVFASGSGKHKLTIGGVKGSRPGELNSPLGVAVDNDNNIVVCDAGNRRVQAFNAQGKFLGVITDCSPGRGGSGDGAVPRDLTVFSAQGKLAVLVAGGDLCEVRIYPYGPDAKGECSCS